MQPDAMEREDYFKHHFYNMVHLYAQGQCYIMSIDLARFVAQEAAAITYVSRRNDKTLYPKQFKAMARYNYTEGHEDHDVSAMAFHSPHPIQFQLLDRYQKFWRHPIKNQKNVKMQQRWDTEIERIERWVPLHHNKPMQGMYKDPYGWWFPLNHTIVEDDTETE